MIKAGELAAQALELAGKNAVAGVSTWELDRIVNDYVVSKGGHSPCKGYGGFPGHNCFSVNEELIHGIPSKKKILKEGEDNSPPDAKFTLVFAINYGGRNEIVNAVNRAVERGEKVDKESFSHLLYTDGLPDPDLIIRTGGEIRLSNFLTFQSAYAELYFTDVLFPDFDKKEFDRAIENYSKRERRFGRI